jgi:UTP--glucose-1-phosphate uridylyltransferase
MIKKVRKAVIPAAGFGTRFLPQTKAMPKEMLPIVDRPVIQYVVESLVKAGIEDIIIITGFHKRTIEDHFDTPNRELMDSLMVGGEKKKEWMKEIEDISNLANFFYVRQKGPYGNGTPLLNVRNIIGDEPFIYTWSDDMILADPGEFEQLISVYEKYGSSVLAGVRAKEDKDYDLYGYVGGKELEPGVVDIDKIIEKPGKDKAPSDLASVSGFLFTSDIFSYLDKAVEQMAPGGELYYNDMLKLMLEDGKQILAAEIVNGEYFDTGSKLSYLKTVVKFASEDKRFGSEFVGWLKTFLLK